MPAVCVFVCLCACACSICLELGDVCVNKYESAGANVFVFVYGKCLVPCDLCDAV